MHIHAYFELFLFLGHINSSILIFLRHIQLNQRITYVIISSLRKCPLKSYLISRDVDTNYVNLMSITKWFIENIIILWCIRQNVMPWCKKKHTKTYNLNYNTAVTLKRQNVYSLSINIWYISGDICSFSINTRIHYYTWQEIEIRIRYILLLSIEL